MKQPDKIRSQPEFEKPSLVIGWQEDAGILGHRIINYLRKHLQGERFYEIEPVDFFNLAGVEIDRDVARFPMSRFYAGERKDLILFESNQPLHRHYEFLNSILDTGEFYCRIQDIYTIGGIISPFAHTSSSRLMAVYNSIDIQELHKPYNLEALSWEGPPAISSYLLWLAAKRNLPGVSLWAEIPFYLAAKGAPQATRKVLDFFNMRFDLGLDFSEIDNEINAQNEKLTTLRMENSEIDKYIRMLEIGLSLDNQEQLYLAKEVTRFLELASL